MADSRTLRSIPPLMPPSRPKKSPPPRLTPRRSSRRRFSLSRLEDDQENNINAGPARRRSFTSCNLRKTSSFSIPTSPLKTASSDAATRSRGAAGGDQHQSPNLDSKNSIPLSPSMASTTRDPTAPPSASKGSNKGDMSVFDFVDDSDSAPLTPRNLVMDPSAQVALTTPPVNSPTPLVVSAKIVGSKVRRNKYSTKRRRPQTAVDSPSSSEEDEAMQLPEGLSPSERAKEYWKRCYGTQKPQDLVPNPQTSWSAKRAAPTKGCLSHSKPKRNAHTSIMLPPTFALQSPPPAHSSKSPVFSTPTSSPDEINQPQPKCSHSKSVQFGVAQAATYELGAPSDRFTPLQFEDAQEQFPLTAKKEDETEGEEIAETKENSAMLAEWEEDFDTLAEDSETDERHRTCKSKHKKRQTSKVSSKHRKRHRKGNRSERRQSSAFCSPRNGKALYDPAEDVEITPEKNGEAVIENMSSLKSPNQPSESMASDDDTARSSSLSPVPARRLSREVESIDSKNANEMAILISQDEEATTPPSLQQKAGLPASIFSLALKMCNSEPVEETMDVQIVFRNLSLCDNPLSEEDSDDSLDLVRSSVGWQSSMQQPFSKTLDTFLAELEPSPSDRSLQEGKEVIPTDLRRKFEASALVEWRKVELSFLHSLIDETTEVQRQVVRKGMSVDSVSAAIPARASVDPTQKHIAECLKSIEELENQLKEEAEKKQRLERRYDIARLQTALVRASFSALSHHAVCYLSPVNIAMSHRENAAIFNHLLDGMATRLELDESTPTTVCRATGSDEISTFCNEMICSGDSGSLQGGFLELLSGAATTNVSDLLLQLAAILARVDMAALSLQELSNVYDVSVHSVVQEGHQVVVVKVLLPQDTVLHAFYHRGKAKSMYWSLPSTVTIEQNGEALPIPPGLLALLSSASVTATARFLPAFCEKVVQATAVCT